MTANELREFLIWSVAINYGALLFWFGVFFYGHDWLYRLHTRWFKLSVERFDALTYGGMALYKIGVLLLNVVPLIALLIVT